MRKWSLRVGQYNGNNQYNWVSQYNGNNQYNCILYSDLSFLNNNTNSLIVRNASECF